MPLENEKVLHAIKDVKEKRKHKKFEQSIELIINLKDIDLKKPENRFQELVELPYLPGRKIKISVIATGDMALRAERAGADLVIPRSELKALSGDKKRRKEIAKTYDFFIAEAPLMPIVGSVLGSALGPKGKMPTPLPPNANIEEQIEKHRKMVRIRLRNQPVLQCRVGTEKTPDEEIAENVQTVIRRLERKLKRGLVNIKSVYLKLTMSSPVRVR